MNFWKNLRSRNIKRQAEELQNNLAMMRDIGTKCAEDGVYYAAQEAVDSLAEIRESYEKEKVELSPEWFEAGGDEDFVEQLIHEYTIEIQDAVKARKEYYAKQRPWTK